MHRPHRLNVVGDYYVVDGCCTACGVPDVEASDLFGWDDSHCYVKKQPVAPAEVGRMLNTIAKSDLRCIRYRGTDATILEALCEKGEAEQCDALT
jgi:hypothetical protein